MDEWGERWGFLIVGCALIGATLVGAALVKVFGPEVVIFSVGLVFLWLPLWAYEQRKGAAGK